MWLFPSVSVATSTCQRSLRSIRDRLILIATLDSADLFPHLPVCWPPTQRQTLESYLNLLDLQEPWLSQCTLTDELLKIYMDPHLLPKSWDQRGKPVKRQRKDVEQYRIKHPHGTFGCIMSNYSYGHLLPDTSLQHSGLFGTLIALPTGIEIHEHSRDFDLSDDRDALLVTRRSQNLHPFTWKFNLLCLMPFLP